eukprot:jgi/Ulvmu1/9997/UM059_0046.1
MCLNPNAMGLRQTIEHVTHQCAADVLTRQLSSTCATARLQQHQSTGMAERVPSSGRTCLQASPVALPALWMWLDMSSVTEYLSLRLASIIRPLMSHCDILFVIVYR